MALSTAKFSGLPFHNPLPLSLRCRLCCFPFSVSASSSSPLRVADRDGRSRGEGNSSDSPYPANSRAKFPSRAPSAPWLQQWASSDHATTPPPGKKPTQPADTSSGSIERIVHRLRNMGLGVDYDDDADAEDAPPSGNERLGELLERSWNRPNAPGDLDRSLLPWERECAKGFVEEDEGKGLKRRRVKAPTLAELTVEDEELRRLRRNGMTLRERITVPKAGITQVITEKIHDAWRKSELVRLKFHEDLAQDMKTAHELIERRTGGLVIWRSGSVMVVYRGSNYKRPSGSQIDPDAKSVKVSQEIDTLFIPDVSSATKMGEDNDLIASRLDQPETSETNLDCDDDMTPEETEYNSLLDGLGPRFVDWWGTGVLPVDADLLPQTIPGYKTPFRLLPTGMRSRLTNAEMTNLRNLAKSMPCHFALGRNRHHQGLASAILKLWEKSLVVKIAVKRGIQNTNNELMAEELKALTGGILLLRNKYYIVIYRGKDFIPTSVATALAERKELTKDIQDAEEKSRYSMVQEFSIEEDKEYLLKKEHDGCALAGTLEEFQEAQARWGREISAEERDAMKEEASRSKSAKLFKKMEHKLFLAQAKKLRAEKLLAKIETSMVPVNPSDDRETITTEEQSVFRKIGLRMKAYLPLGIRGVFDGVIENMHLHWKHRELVKLISKQKTLSFVKDTARLLEYESGGILVAIERVPKGFALIYYRGKNYKRPINIRPRNLLTKAKALKRAVAMQRHEALSQHILELEGTINQMKLGLGISEDEERVMNDLKQINSDQFPCSSETENEDSFRDSEDYDNSENDDSE